MTAMPSACVTIEPALVAAATGDADPVTVQHVHRHLDRCRPCAQEFGRYRRLDGLVTEWRRQPEPDTGGVRKRLEQRLADLRHRTLDYRIFPSPLGHLLIARSEQGVCLLEYLGPGGGLARSRLRTRPDLEVREDGAEIEGLFRELLEYLEGRRQRLEWPLDLRLVRSDFHRTVLETTAGIPYGAVMSYAGVACEVGRPAAVRAVAQALRWNPLPIVVPCHRVVGSSGSLTGYAGNKLTLKERLLLTERIPVVRGQRDVRIPRRNMYLAAPGGTEYCLPTCTWVDRLEHPNRLRLFGARDLAEASGLAPCTDCRPDLHPLEP